MLSDYTLRALFTLKILSHRNSYCWLERTQSSPNLAWSNDSKSSMWKELSDSYSFQYCRIKRENDQNGSLNTFYGNVTDSWEWNVMRQRLSPNRLLMYSVNVKNSENIDRWWAALSSSINIGFGLRILNTTDWASLALPGWFIWFCCVYTLCQFK